MGTKAKAVWFESPGNASIREADLKKPGENDLLIKTRKTLISPGTELAFYEGKHTQMKSGQVKFPKIAPGYSNVGVIVQTGEDVKGFKPGGRVLSMTTHADIWITPSSAANEIPANLDDEQALFGITGAICLYGIRDAAPQYGENILISGMGLIGQIALRLIRMGPAKNVICTDSYSSRRKLAEKGGSDFTFSPEDENLYARIEEITSGRGCDVVIEASGNPAAFPAAMKAASLRGRVLILGCPHGKATLDMYTEMQKKEIQMIGSYMPRCPAEENPRYPWTHSRNRELILYFLDQCKLNFSELITHRDNYLNAPRLYKLLSEDKENTITAVLDWE